MSSAILNYFCHYDWQTMRAIVGGRGGRKTNVLPRTPVCGILLPYVHNPESRRKILRTGQQKKEMVVMGSTTQIRKFVIDDEAYWRFEGLKKETWIYTWLARLIAVRERMLEFYSN